MKRKYQEIEEEISKKPKVVVHKKREREYYNKHNQCAEYDEEDDVVETIKKGIIQKIKLQYNFVNIDKTKVPNYIL
uniref:Uncharacterized protein n=1 Tax=viral metagenome TaxID=1070528 RepID=A0A6C0HE43_9ZZZZ